MFAVGCSSNDGGDGGSGGSATTTASSSAGTGGGSTSSVDPNEPFAAQRTACINEINKLRATKGLTPYTYWQGVDSCLDQQATSDEMTQMPHGAWLSMKYSCDGNAQNECLGQGANGIVECLDQMWAEKDQPNCQGCDACADQIGANCPGCDFYGQMGMECGHYVNMSSKALTQAACGFSTPDGWDVINFTQ